MKSSGAPSGNLRRFTRFISCSNAMASTTLEQEPLKHLDFHLAKAAQIQIDADLFLVLRERRLALSVGLDELGREIELEAHEGEQLLVEFKRLLRGEAVGQPNEGKLIGKAQAVVRAAVCSWR